MFHHRDTSNLFTATASSVFVRPTIGHNRKKTVKKQSKWERAEQQRAKESIETANQEYMKQIKTTGTSTGALVIAPIVPPPRTPLKTTSASSSSSSSATSVFYSHWSASLSQHLKNELMQEQIEFEFSDFDDTKRGVVFFFTNAENERFLRFSSVRETYLQVLLHWFQHIRSHFPRYLRYWETLNNSEQPMPEGSQMTLPVFRPSADYEGGGGGGGEHPQQHSRKHVKEVLDTAAIFALAPHRQMKLPMCPVCKVGKLQYELKQLRSKDEMGTWVRSCINKCRLRN